MAGILVVSRDCTHTLPAHGLELVANVPTSVPAKALSDVLALTGVERITPIASTTEEEKQ